MTDWANTFPRLRVEHVRGVDFFDPACGLSFDGGSLLVFKDSQQTQFLQAYAPSTRWDAGIEKGESHEQG